MSIVGESNGLFIALKAWVQERKPVSPPISAFSIISRLSVYYCMIMWYRFGAHVRV